MNNGPLHLALRELHREFSRPTLWISLVGAGLVLAFAGAFGTGDVLRPVPLGLYWVAMAIVTYAAGSLVAALLRPVVAGQNKVLRVLVMGTATGAVISGLILGINTALFGAFWSEGGALLRFLGTTFGVTFVIATVLDTVLGQAAAADVDPVDKIPALLARLPLDKRGGLISLTAVDHYVEVRTTNGQELVLMRLADAIAETAPAKGLQVHRSHWVAVDQVASVARGSGKATLTLSDGREVPVSRANLPALKDAGLLPGTQNA